MWKYFHDLSTTHLHCWNTAANIMIAPIKNLKNSSRFPLPIDPYLLCEWYGMARLLWGYESCYFLSVLTWQRNFRPINCYLQSMVFCRRYPGLESRSSFSNRESLGVAPGICWTPCCWAPKGLGPSQVSTRTWWTRQDREQSWFFQPPEKDLWAVK